MYAKLEKLYNSIKPLRGTDLRPVGRRSKENRLMIRKEVNRYVLTLYRTDIITAWPDGSVTLAHGGWLTITTYRFLREYSPWPISSVNGYMVVSTRAGSYVVRSEGLNISADGVATNPFEVTKTIVVTDLKLAYKVRKHYAKVLDIATVAHGLGSRVYGNRIEMIQAMQDLDTPLSEEAATKIAVNIDNRRGLEDIKKELYEVAYRHHGVRTLVKTTLPIGQVQ